MRDEYKILVDYKASNPSASVRILCGSMNVPVVDENGIEFEGSVLSFIIDMIESAGADNVLSYEPNTDLKYKICSTNNHGHYFRCQLIDYFEKYGLINDSNIVTWHNKRVNPEYKFRWFDGRTMEADNLYASGNFDYHVTLPQYNQVFMDTLSESAIDSWFLTEKTVKPLMWLKPFIVWTAAGYHRFLEDLGFKLFPELIDYAFDSEPDQELRCEMFAQQARRINNMSLTGLS